METLPAEEQITRTGDEHLYLQVKESRANFQHVRTTDTRTIGQGQFGLILDIIALQGAVYIPISIASSKKPTGFVYQIEGTSQGDISTAEVSCRGEGVTQITLGTLRYAKIPQGSTAHFRFIFHIEGGIGKVYKIVINRINYKLNPNDARYKKFNTTISTDMLKFK